MDAELEDLSLVPNRSICALVITSLLMMGRQSLAHDELSCAPAAAPAPSTSGKDAFFERSRSAWLAVTTSHYIEGNGACPLVQIRGYEGFPTRHCTYSSVDAGKGHFSALPAQVIVLDPSARQLAAWSITACRTNGASDAAMPHCLDRLRADVVGSNGAQFPVVGSVVESFCNSSKDKPPCSALGPSDHDLAPRNTLFRDGVSVSYRSIAHWTEFQLPDLVYGRLFDTAHSDEDIDAWYDVSRLSTAVRHEWGSWRQHVGKPVIPEGASTTGFDLRSAGWGIVSREIHKRACSGQDNELFDAVVHSRRYAQ